MKTTKIKQRIANAFDAFFADENFSPGQIAVREYDYDLQNQNGGDSLSGSFSLWAFAKCLLFYVPGVAMLFTVTLVLTHFLVFENENIGNFTFAFFWLGFGAFLTMFGIGKLAELKYLKILASIFITSFAIALPFLFVSEVLKGSFSGIHSLYFLPIVVLVGYLTKKWIDREEAKLL